MQLFDRLFKIKKHQQRTQNDNSIKSADSNSTSSSTSSSIIGYRHGSIRRFSSLRHWRSTSKPMSHSNIVLDQQQQQQQQDLLTQCIETALYVNPTSTHSSIKRWSYGNAPLTNNISFQEQEPSPPPAQPRQRKLSLPPQPTHIGYLASIPEVESQLTLDFNE
ncbi:Ribonucleotide-diphosphate reductase (RNR), small subunit [Mucor velutinosus]|uniref:Ribonucleotide-diphosphate reductase (RNR), small subunit n=1 Tax=Mucor velutinosus TaxID=708070 RepID=A0AAN7DJB9_9FUNG|nr:Ribonucleotide-diphosphate reductase (RNR), small subunit [Mucor velutinosus]